MRRGRTVALYVSGRSGVGKSHLVRRFLDGLIERKDAVVLTGRCYEQESVPYKALDSAIDALSRYLKRLPCGGSAVRRCRATSTCWPASSPSCGTAKPLQPPPGGCPASPIRRRCGGVASRPCELLARLGDRRPLVLFLDDLQWGDADTRRCSASCCGPPTRPYSCCWEAIAQRMRNRVSCFESFAPCAGGRAKPGASRAVP